MADQFNIATVDIMNWKKSLLFIKSLMAGMKISGASEDLKTCPKTVKIILNLLKIF